MKYSLCPWVVWPRRRWPPRLYDPTKYALEQYRDHVGPSLESLPAFVEAPDTIFSIPTYRLRDVPETIEHYDENFWRNGHEVRLFVFDDSSVANHDKYYSQLEKTRTANPLYYVGPQEKERFIQVLLHRLREPKLEALVRNLFRPSYGGNRNFTLMYSLGAFLVSSDDDMRPTALIEHSPESLATDEICRGKLMHMKPGRI